jgi:RHS repeat-associated protein
VTAIQLANATRSSYSYDVGNNVLVLANITSTGTTLSSFIYSYNKANNRTQVVEVNGDVVSWTYDATYQLTNEHRSGANSYNITYSYDAVGNRLTLNSNGAITTSTYNAANELATSQTTSGVTTYSFDGSGNLLTSLAPGNQLTSYTWDGENRLTQVALPSGIVDTFRYNGDGQRVQKQDSTGTTKHVWDGQNILLETNASNILQVVYTLEPLVFGNLISQSRGGTDSFYLFDLLGSTRQLASGVGAVTDTYLYDSFGSTLLASGTTTNPYRYVGRLGYLYDADLARYYVRARYYDPVFGAFLSRDPIGLAPWSQFYAYCLNQAPNGSDPSGALPAAIPIAILAISAILGCYLAAEGEVYRTRVRGSDKWKHCALSCRMARTCAAEVAELAGLLKEIGPNVIDDYLNDWQKQIADTLGDLRANQACLTWETWIPFGGWIGTLCRESCDDCCDREVGRWTTTY